MATFSNVGYPTNVQGAATLNTAAINSNVEDHNVMCVFDGQVHMQMTTPQTEAWFHFAVYQDNINKGLYRWLYLYDTNGDVVLDFYQGNSPSFILHYEDGGSTQTLASTLRPLIGQNTVVDLHVKLNNAGSGYIVVYFDMVEVIRIENLSNSGFLIDHIQLGSKYTPNGNTSYRMRYYSFLLGEGNSPTVGRLPFARRPIGDSATNNSWSGTFTDVDESQSTADGNLNSSTVAGERQSFTITPIVISAPISEVEIVSSGIQDTAGVIDYEHSVNIAAVDYDQGAVNAQAVTTQERTKLSVNPATVAAWTTADINSAEFGVVSV